MDKKQNAIVDVVYPVYGQFGLLETSINNLAIATTKPYNIYLVDDNSKENGKETYQKLNKNPKVKSIQYHKKNEGFPKTVNDGAKLGFAKYILVINTDVVLFEKSLDLMVDFLEQNPEVGIVGPKLLFFPNTNDPYRPANKVQHAGIAFDSMGYPYHIYSGWNHDHPKVNMNRSVNAITGACMLIRRSLWRSLNGFDLGYGKGTWEDMDICLRAKLQKHQVYYLHTAAGYHFTNASVLAAKEEFPLNENALYFRRKFGNLAPYDDYILDYV